jgi:hypothetical protein
MHFNALAQTGIGVYSAAVVCSRCGGSPRPCVVLQSRAGYHVQAFCKVSCWEDLQVAIRNGEELKP